MLPGINSVMVPRGKAAGFAPVVAGSATDSAGNTSSTNLTLPSSISAGNLLLLFVALGRDSNVNINTPSGWTVLFNEGSPVRNDLRRLAAFYRVATGSEGASVSASSSISCEWASVSLRITGYQGIGSFSAVGNLTEGTGTSASIASVVVPWVWRDNLALAIAASNPRATSEPTPPSGYTTIASGSIGSGTTVRVTVAQKVSDALTEAPGPFTMPSSFMSWGTKLVVLG